ncbi:DUF4198 domain-containing protein [Enterobacteriaceae bacterium RIT691]|nr:DUF4198 domain-containing protein [Enterobacteriaceae bacterium RIT691]
MKWVMSSVLALSVFAASSVQAHEFWMVPHDALSKTDAQVLFELRIGSGIPGKQSPRIPGLVSDFTATDADGSYAVSGHDNSLVTGHLRPRRAGATIAALRTNEAQITLSAAEFEAYLREEGLEKIIRQRQENGDSAQPDNELYSRCAKSIILVDGQSQGFDKAVGLPLELIPQTEPLSFKPGQSYRLRLLRDGQPLVGTQVKAQMQGQQRYQLKVVTDANGEVALTLPESGVWLFSAVDMVPSQSPDADWDSLWASLTLAIGKEAG